MKTSIVIASLLFSANVMWASLPLMPGTPALQPVNAVGAAPTVSGGVIKKITPATTVIITDTPQGERMSDVVWASRACAPVDGKPQWAEVEGFVPEIVTDGTGMYIHNPITQLSEIAQAWIEGTINADGGTVTFPTPQAYMLNEATPGVVTMLYATRVSSTTGKPEAGNTDLVFEITEDGMNQTDGGLLALTDEAGNFYGYGDMNIIVSRITDSRVTLPEGAEISTYTVEYNRNGNQQIQSARVALSGSEVYFSDPLGMEGVWFKGALSGNTVTVPGGQYLGSESGFPMYIMAAEAFKRTEVDPMGQPYEVIDYNVFPERDITFVYDAATGEYKCDGIMLLNAGKTTLGMAYLAMHNPVYKPWEAVKATPQKPSIDEYVDLKEYESIGLYGCFLIFRVPYYSTEGGFLPQEKIFYEITIDGKTLEFFGETQLPYYGQFQDASTMTALTVGDNMHQLQLPYSVKKGASIRSYYYYKGELIPSEEARYKLENDVLVPEESSVELTEADTALPLGVNYYDMTGRRLVSPAAGTIVIKECVMSDGTSRREKIIVK